MPVASRAQAAQGIARPNLRPSALDPEPFVILFRGPYALLQAAAAFCYAPCSPLRFFRHLAQHIDAPLHVL